MGPVTQLLPRSLLSLALHPAAPAGSGARAARLAPRRRRWRHQRSRLSSPVSAVSPSVGEQVEFDWLDTWCPLAPVCDLDPGAPHGKTVLGLHVVAWYDRAASLWRVFEDECPHRRAPLSEGRIDGKGRLQCVYHGWCFDGRGSCEFIPQAPALGPPERNYVRAGVENWHKVVYAPTSSDAVVFAFRDWFRKHCKSQIGWAAPVDDQLPTTPTKDRLMDRYWSHVAQCTSCSAALKAMKALEVALQAASVAVVGFLAASKGTLVMSVIQRAALVSLAVLCFATSRWLAGFVQKNFYFQDYVHAYK
uniref:Uncharacterized protein n=1 Tax=Avena sativa TaxID=4498 RepID=A0ACD5W8M7_AVESA